MGFIYALRSEQEKTKHTSFGAIHFCVPDRDDGGHCYFLLTIPSMPAPQTVKSSK